MNNEIENKIEAIKNRLALQEIEPTEENTKPELEFAPPVEVVEEIIPVEPPPPPPPSPTPYPVHKINDITNSDQTDFVKSFSEINGVATLTYESKNNIGEKFPYFQYAKVLVKNAFEEIIFSHRSYTRGKVVFRLPYDCTMIELVESWTDLNKNKIQSYGTFSYELK